MTRLSQYHKYYYQGDGTYTRDPAGIPASTLLDGLTSWYAMEETSGNRIDQHSGYDLVDAGSAGSRVGKIGNAVDLTTATTSYLSATDVNVHNIVGDWSAMCWLEHDSFPTYGTPFGIITGGNPGALWGYVLFMAGNVLSWYVCSGTTYPAISTALTAGTKYCIYTEYNATTGEFGLSVDNGTLTTLAVATPNPVVGSGLFVGAWNGLGRYMDGLVDELAIYKGRILTEAERTEYFAGVTYGDL